jgi:hypothetical protein
MSKTQVRKTAYPYIKGQIGNPHGFHQDAVHPPIIPLNELLLLKEGLADPSVELVASLNKLLGGYVTEADIGTHLIAPFQPRRVD